MLKIDSALPSPRIVNGIIEWYAFDTFSLGISFDIKDADGEDIVLGTGDSVTVSVRNDRGETVKEFEFENIMDNSVTLEFDGETTALFPEGMYFYDITADGDRRVTLARGNRMRVR